MKLNMNVLLILLLLFSITTACFITNCPPGGKRSVPKNFHFEKQCTRCGPDGTGRCFGPEICCGSEIGCQFSNSFTKVCRTENDSLRPCQNKGKICDNGKGTCAINSVCCSSSGCFIDKTCTTTEDIQIKYIDKSLEGRFVLDTLVN